MKILLTGSSGFVGRNLLEELGANYTWLAPAHAELDLLNTAAVEEYLRQNRVDIVIHSAVDGVSITPYDDLLSMFGNLLRGLGSTYDRLIYFGSGAEFAKTRDLVKVKEEELGQVIPQDPYGLAKYIICQTARNDRRITNLRLFGVYGRYEKYLFKFISNAIVKNLLGLDLRIMQDVVFDYLDVMDLPIIAAHFIEHPGKYSDYNITPTASICLTEVVAIINRIANQPSEVDVVTPGLNYQYTGDNARLLVEMPSLRFTSYPDSIARLYHYYEDNIDKLDREAVLQDAYSQRVKLKK